MPCLFNDSAGNYLELNSAVVSSYPLSMACWFKCDDAANIGTLMAITASGGATEFHRMVLVGTASPKELRGNTGASGEVNATVTAWSANTWHHAAYVCSNATSRSIFLDGSKVTNTTSKTPSGLNCTSWGTRNLSGRGQYFSGEIAEAAIWNVALTDNEVSALYNRHSPALVAPNGLVHYRYFDQGGMGLPWLGTAFTSTSGTTFGNTHIPMIYPDDHGSQGVAPAVAVGKPALFHEHYVNQGWA